MNTLELVLTPLVFVGGFVLGFVGGVKYQKRKLTREVAVEARALRVWLGKSLDFVTSRRFVGAFMILIALLVYYDNRQHAHQHSQDTARIAASSAQVKQLGECVAAYDNRLSAALQPVRKASKKNGAADIAFKLAVAKLFIPGNDKADVAAVKKALNHNIAVYNRLASERAKNPYPKPPRKVCPQ